MNTKLRSHQNWHKLARQSAWSVAALAKLCKVSTDTLRRHFIVNMGKSPRHWLMEERQRQAVELLCDGSSVKETATRLGYKQQTNFTRKFKEHWGVCPSRHRPSGTRPVLREND